MKNWKTTAIGFLFAGLTIYGGIKTNTLDSNTIMKALAMAGFGIVSSDSTKTNN